MDIFECQWRCSDSTDWFWDNRECQGQDNSIRQNQRFYAFRAGRQVLLCTYVYVKRLRNRANSRVTDFLES